jgi:hypothetical protein
MTVFHCLRGEAALTVEAPVGQKARPRLINVDRPQRPQLMVAQDGGDILLDKLGVSLMGLRGYLGTSVLEPAVVCHRDLGRIDMLSPVNLVKKLAKFLFRLVQCASERAVPDTASPGKWVGANIVFELPRIPAAFPNVPSH